MNIQDGPQQQAFCFREQIVDRIEGEKEIGRSKIEDFSGAEEKESPSGAACCIAADSSQETGSSPWNEEGQKNMQKTSPQPGLVECGLDHILGFQI